MTNIEILAMLIAITSLSLAAIERYRRVKMEENKKLLNEAIDPIVKDFDVGEWAEEAKKILRDCI